MSFPFDEKLKAFMAKLGGNRAARRAARRRQRLIEQSNPGYRLEALEPRILLSADPFSALAGYKESTQTLTLKDDDISSVAIEAKASGAFLVTVSSDSESETISLTGPNTLTIKGTEHDDNFVIKFTKASNAQLPEGFKLVVDGMGGDDHITVGGAGAWGNAFAGGRLEVRAEQITVDAVLGGAGHETAGVALKAKIEAEEQPVNDGPVTRNVGITVNAGAGIHATGNIEIKAQSQGVFSTPEHGLANLSFNGEFKAAINLAETAILSGDKVWISALSDVAFAAQTTPSSAVSDFAVSLVQAADITAAQSAQIVAKSSHSDALRLTADILSDIDAGIEPIITGLSGLVGLDAHFARLDLTRHADILIGDPLAYVERNLEQEDYTSSSWSQVDLPAQSFKSSSGAQNLKIGDVVRVSEGHEDGGEVGKTYIFLGDQSASVLQSAGDIALKAYIGDRDPNAAAGTRLEVDSALLGAARLVTDDRARILAQNIAFNAENVVLESQSDATHVVAAQFAEIASRGLVSADLNAWHVADPYGVQTLELSVAATDAARFRSISSVFNLDAALSNRTNNGDPGYFLDIEVFGAINSLERDVRAQIRGGQFSAGSVKLVALADQRLDAFVRAQASIVAGAVPYIPAPEQAAAASYAINRLSGGVSARLIGSEISSDTILVDARNSAVIDARVEAGAATTGGPSGAAALSVALNILGYDSAPSEHLAHRFTDAQDNVSLAEGDVVKTSDNRYYRALAQVSRSRSWHVWAQSIAGVLPGREVHLIAQRCFAIPDIGAVRAFAHCAQVLTHTKRQISDLAITLEHSLRGRHVISI